MIEKIGIVGGGQLGRMLTEAAHPLGFQVTVLDPSPNCPAAQVGAEQIVGGLNDESAIEQVATKSDVTTWEIEHIDSDCLIRLQDEGHNIQPDPNSLKIIQDKWEQKRFLRDKGLPVADFEMIAVPSFDYFSAVARNLGGEVIIKARQGGYDGRGNVRYNAQSWLEIEKEIGSKRLYAEKVVDFDKELSVIAARDHLGKIAVYPVVETQHIDNICHMVMAPANVSPSVADNAEEIARETLKHLGGAGVYAIEMFKADEDLVINEIAPRVHNSGHHTIEANETSQFEQHIRAISGLPLGRTNPRTPAAVMINILGTRDEKLSRDGLEEVTKLKDTHVHFYGKDPRPARKIGHITVLGTDMEKVGMRAIKARGKLSV